MTRATAILATLLFVTSISLSLYYKGIQRQSGSMLEQAPVQSEPIAPSAPQAPVAGK